MKRLNLLVYITLITCLSLCSTRSTAQNLLSESFDGATFPPTGWQNNLIALGAGGCGTNASYGSDDCTGPLIWAQSTGGVRLCPSANIAAPAGHSGTHAAGWNSWDIRSGGTADLVSPAMSVIGGTYTLTFWSYRAGSDPVYVYASTTRSSTGATLLTTINSSNSAWAQTTVVVPASFITTAAGGNMFIIFHAVSGYGNDLFFDDVSFDRAGCSGTPTASTITTAPLATPACSNSTVTLTANEANTVPGITPYWQQSSSPTGPWITAVGGSGVNSSIYTTPFLTTSIYYRYADTCTYTRTGNASAPYYVPVTQSNTITTQPPFTAVCTGGNTSIAVSAIGGNLTYQWQVSTDNGVTFNNVVTSVVYSNPTTATLGLTAVPLSYNNNKYRVIVNGTCGTTQTSAAATLNVGGAPTVTTQPRDTTICTNNNGAFTVVATGANLSYQWQVDNGTGFANVNNGPFYLGVTTSTLSVTGAFQYMDGYRYRVLVNGACNPTQSAPATLHVNGLPVIVTQPVNDTECNANLSRFVVKATGAGLTYQWQRSINNGAFTNLNNTAIYAGATKDTLYIHDSTLQSGNRYRVIIVGTCAPIDTSNIVTLVVNAQPVVSITALGSSVICPSDSAAFSGVPGPGYTYRWYRNDVAITGNAAARDTFKANAAGAYSVAITNAYGCTSFTGHDTVTYLPAPVSTITAGGPLGFCQGSNVVLTGNTNTGVTYAWKLNGNYISNATRNVDTVTQSGTYTLYQNNGTCGTISNSLVVTASAIPTATISTTGTSTICSGQSVTLRTNTANGYTYQWSLNGTPQTSGSASSFVATNAGTYTVQTFSGPGCSVVSSGFPVTVLPSPAAAIVATGNSAICPGGTALLNATAPANVTYQWALNSNNIAGATYVGYGATTAGNYTVKVVAQNGCSTTSAPFAVQLLPAVTAVVTSNKPDTLCLPDSLTLSTPLGTNLTYVWYNNNLPTYDSTNKIVVHGAGSYTVQVANAGCSTLSAPVVIAAGPQPTGYVTAQPGIGQYQGTICGGSPALLAAPAGSGYTYQWYYQGSIITGSFSQYYSATIPGYYTVVITTPVGCVYHPVQDTVMAGTVPSPVVSFDGAQVCAFGFSGWQWYFNGSPIQGATGPCTDVHQVGGYSVAVTNSTGCSATSAVYDVLEVGVPNVTTNAAIKLYPNPATSVINIDAPVQVNVNVMSIDGKLLLHTEKTRSVNIEGLANGMYLISVYDQDNNLLKTEKVVKN